MEAGFCPKCNENTLEYGVLEPEDESIFYPVVCAGCGFKGKEYYNLTFDGFYDNDGNKVEENDGN